MNISGIAILVLVKNTTDMNTHMAMKKTMKKTTDTKGTKVPTKKTDTNKSRIRKVANKRTVPKWPETDTDGYWVLAELVWKKPRRNVIFEKRIQLHELPKRAKRGIQEWFEKGRGNLLLGTRWHICMDGDASRD